MRIVELSNHPGDELRRTRERRARAEQQAQARDERGLSAHHERVRQAVAARDLARARRRWLTWLRAALAVRGARRRVPPPPARVVRVSDQEEKYAAGAAGEKKVADELGRVLSDDWTLIHGYHNDRGEIDYLLLGARGLVAIEVKYYNATVNCDGDTWRFDECDNYGNRKRSGSRGDAGGRSPSRQLNEPAGKLDEFLRSRGHRVPMLRAVIFNHERSRIGTCRNATVDIIARSTDRVLERLRRMPARLDKTQLAELIELIKKDHRFHEARRPRRA